MRSSSLETQDYRDLFFDTGAEHSRQT
jgi:hypothetical protein